MLKWLRDRNAPTRVAIIESLPVEGKRKVILVRRDNIEHLVMVGGRNDLLIESNIMHRPAPSRRLLADWTLCEKRVNSPPNQQLYELHNPHIEMSHG